MIRLLGNFLHRTGTGFDRARRDERGNATIEFVLWVPFFITLMLASLESGLMLVQRSMLERAMDLTIRDLRIATILNPTHEDLKTVLCNRVLIIPSCTYNLLLEMQVVDTTTWGLPPVGKTCVDRSLGDDLQPVTTYQTGGKNDLVIMRACIKINPFFVTTGIGLQLRRDAAGMYALAATSAFANEPR